MVSKTYPNYHIMAGKPTNFKQQILDKQKIHTVRSNYTLWNNIANAVNKGRGVISLREWDSKPYRSKQIEFMQLEKISVDPVTITNDGDLVWLNDRYLQDFEVEKFANNDGLSLNNFKDWFSRDMQGVIINFTDFKY